MAAKVIKIKVIEPHDSRTILWEQHSDHPTGEVFIVANDRTYAVAETPKVKALIKAGTIELAGKLSGAASK
jgi:hypothetical protein